MATIEIRVPDLEGIIRDVLYRDIGTEMTASMVSKNIDEIISRAIAKKQRASK
jgi:hypothetical protein